MTTPAKRIHGVWLFALAAMATTTLLASASSASAAGDPIATGATDLHLKKGFARKISNLGATVQPIGVGAVSGNKIALTVRDGSLNPLDVLGFLDTRGGFKLQLGRRGVPVTQLTVNTVKGAVYAKVAGARMQIGSFAPPTFAREGFGANFKATKLTLTAKAVKRISNRLGLKGSKRLNPGRVLSNLYSTAQPETVTLLPQGTAVLAANSSTFTKFAAKGMKAPQGITALAPAIKPTPASFQFPISGGVLAPDASEGTIETAGGVQILKEAEPFSPTMRLRNLFVDLTAKAATAELEILPTPPFPGAAGRSSVVDVVLPSNSVVANPVARTISIQGAEARLQAVFATTLNDVFNQPAPSPPPSSNFILGDPLGTFSITLQAR
ncbi:MAG: hypothetical protein WA862_08325 [Solirubrobacterales bacterium]